MLLLIIKKFFSYNHRCSIVYVYYPSEKNDYILKKDQKDQKGSILVFLVLDCFRDIDNSFLSNLYKKI